jgi:hypothetical protein
VPSIQATLSMLHSKRRVPSSRMDAEEFLASTPVCSLAVDSVRTPGVAPAGEALGLLAPGRARALAEVASANGPSCPSAAVVPDVGEGANVGSVLGRAFGPAPLVDPGVPPGPVGSDPAVWPAV